MSVSPPPYIPAPYLARGSFLTAEQLVSYFQDFYTSLEHLPGAYQYVFERLVGNLNHAFTAVPGQERSPNHDRDLNALDRVKTLELSNSRLKAELEELKAAISTASCNYPVIGNFHTSEVRSCDQPQQFDLNVVPFTRSYRASPHLPMGLTSFHLSGDIALTILGSDIQNDGFQIELISWCNTVKRSASCAWLEVERDDPDFQCGRFDIPRDSLWNKSELETVRNISFRRTYSAPPKLVVWICNFAFNYNADYRMRTYATDVTTTGFTLNVDTWGDSILRDASVWWVSCTENKANVFTGSFGTSDLRSDEFPQPKNSGYVRFGSGLTGPPRVIAAINRFDISSKHDMRLSLKTSDITAAGMSWNLDGWSDSILYSAGASFIAIC